MTVEPIYTVGHSTRPVDELIDLVRAHGVRTVVDIRSIPRSRHNPQYEQATLRARLAAAGLSYSHLPVLGGRRYARRGAPPVNAGWHNDAFRGFADYMATAAFAAGLDALLELAARDGPLALLCAEAVPWRCHRSLVADALVATRGVPVTHILGPGSTRAHALNPLARVVDGIVTYPAPEHAP
jgi:uncharacterized protein (DUF488 family)